MSKLLTAASARTRSIDPRFIIGIAFVLAAVAGVYAVVTATDRSTTVFVARETLVPGDVLKADDVLAASMRDDGTAARYLAPGGIPAEGLVVTRTVSAGELVPVAALGEIEGLRMTGVVISVEGQLGDAIGPGSVVDVWAAEGEEGERLPPPDIIVPGAVVVRLLASESIVAGRQTAAIEVLVPRERTGRLLGAIANHDAMSVVAADLPAGD